MTQDEPLGAPLRRLQAGPMAMTAHGCGGALGTGWPWQWGDKSSAHALGRRGAEARSQAFPETVEKQCPFPHSLSGAKLTLKAGPPRRQHLTSAARGRAGARAGGLAGGAKSRASQCLLCAESLRAHTCGAHPGLPRSPAVGAGARLQAARPCLPGGAGTAWGAGLGRTGQRVHVRMRPYSLEINLKINNQGGWYGSSP